MLSTIKVKSSKALEELYAERSRIKYQNENKKDVIFEFKVSELVEAMHEGNWVLLDNVDSCPESVLERINSVFEESPELIIYECGEIRSVEMNRDFRLFLTSNSNRVQAVKLSCALLNRVIRFWLGPIDDDCTLSTITKQSIKNTESYKILNSIWN